MSAAIRINKFARFTDTVDGHTFTYVGKILATKPMIEMDTGSFIIHCPQEDLPLFTSATRPKNWKPRKKSVRRPKPATKKKTRNKRAPRTGTKLELCRSIYQSNISRAANIENFVREADCTTAGAATYYAKIKKESK